jgi:deoxyguanosine kinase
MKERIAYIGLGSNLGDRENTIRRALELLSEAEHIEVTRVSDLIETAPLGQLKQPKFINGVAEVKTTLSAEELYEKLVEIETLLGRERQGKWTSRTIDLDLLLFGSDVIDLPHLKVPHPQMHLRSFVLKGLCQLNPDLIHPVIKEPAKELAARLNGLDFMSNPNQPQLVSIAGIIGVGKTTLAKGLSKKLDCEVLLEPYDTNPFMPDVYAGKKELALDSQLYFLTQRIGQLSRNVLQPRQVVISDYVFNKEQIYAKRLLNALQLDLYEKIYKPVSAEVTQPALVVFLQDSAKSCLERIRERGRSYEQRIDLHFLETLRNDYEQLFAKWKICPIIQIKMSEFDCMRDSDIECLANQVKCYITSVKIRDKNGSCRNNTIGSKAR